MPFSNISHGKFLFHLLPGQQRQFLPALFTFQYPANALSQVSRLGGGCQETVVQVIDQVGNPPWLKATHGVPQAIASITV